MNAIKATWVNGQILPGEPVDWPEGSELIVEPIAPCDEKIGLSDSEWRDDPLAIAAWEDWVRGIEPPEYSDAERTEMARFREEFRQHNLDAVRRQMEAGAKG